MTAPDPSTGLAGAAEVGRRRRRSKNVAVGLALAALVVLFYLVTVVKIGSTLP